MQLKEDYKDPIYEGSKTYRITQNADGSSGILDTTKYTQEGDRFAANDINSTNAAINQINHVIPVTLTATGWTGDFAPYAQTVMIEGVKADDSPIVVSMLEDGASEEVQKAYSKAYGIITSGTGTTADGSVTFKVYKKPTTDITIGLKGV